MQRRRRPLGLDPGLFRRLVTGEHFLDERDQAARLPGDLAPGTYRVVVEAVNE
jgi:hypothetical protein